MGSNRQVILEPWPKQVFGLNTVCLQVTRSHAVANAYNRVRGFVLELVDQEEKIATMIPPACFAMTGQYKD